TEGEPKGSKGSGTSTNEWILDGWFQQHKGKGDNPPHEILEIWTYDAHTKTYRAWGFMAPGANHYESAGTWDEKTKTLTYKGKGPGDVTFVSTMSFIDEDNRIRDPCGEERCGQISPGHTLQADPAEVVGLSSDVEVPVRGVATALRRARAEEVLMSVL